MPKAHHCMTAELRGMFDTVPPGSRGPSNGKEIVLLQTELEIIAKKVFTISDKAYNITLLCSGDSKKRVNTDHIYKVYSKEYKDVMRLQQSLMGEEVLKKSCCQRAYLRGAFLSGGTISDPNRYYNLEIVCSDENQAEVLQSLMQEMGLHAKIIQRKNLEVVYLQEADQIAEMMRLLGAGQSLMEFENIRIVREMRGTVNRKVNCETANLRKTVSAAHRQIEDIVFLRDNGAFEKMSPSLLRIAEARLQYPEASLTELGNVLNPPVGKSGVNHRMRKIQELAGQLRGVGSKEV